ncbi:MAG: bifunctional DNA-formamidopyrimidine glycosylase/DNA-(apurinic or apyrimidinic site) lyase [Sphaerochaetaceae bacterium]|nr:bifunctional DNA-formamidopyrimidine glycosylase/DNA-(apurinic or apyrimidinic site) lyase [Sphaerochaetaceae bacterium]
MPELPEVETIKRDLIPLFKEHPVIRSVTVYNPSSLSNPHCHTLKDLRVTHIERMGKYLIFSFDRQFFFTIHFRMSGSFFIREPSSPADIHDRVLLTTDGFIAAFHDQRKFGRITVESSLGQLQRKLGPDALDDRLTSLNFHSICRSHSRMIKPFLLDQKVVCGLGNIYTDEILFAAKIHPGRKTDTLTRAETDSIFFSMRRILNEGIKARGTSLGDTDGNFQSGGGRGNYQHSLQVFQRKGELCRRCKSVIIATSVGGRTTHLCPYCQKP